MREIHSMRINLFRTPRTNCKDCKSSGSKNWAWRSNGKSSELLDSASSVLVPPEPKIVKHRNYQIERIALDGVKKLNAGYID